MNVLFLRRNGENRVGAPKHYHSFEMEVGKHVDGQWAGEDWPLHRSNEPFHMTVKRVMPNADWVIDKERDQSLPRNRGYMTGAYFSDLHGRGAFRIKEPTAYVESVNNVGYDVVFMRYLELHGVEDDPNIFLDELEPAVYFLPWSIDTDLFAPAEEKYVDLAFIGSIGKIYPLRLKLWSEFEQFCFDRKLNYIKTKRVSGASSFKKPSEFNNRNDFITGDRYVDALSKTKFFIFGCSKYRYPLLKYFEAMASGCVVFADEPSSARELGFVDGVNYVKINGDNWVEKVDYYLEHSEKAQKIAVNALEYAVTNHSHGVRAAEFIEILNQFL